MDLVHRGKEEGMNIPQQLLSNPGSVEKEKSIDLMCNRFGLKFQLYHLLTGWLQSSHLVTKSQIHMYIGR